MKNPSNLNSSRHTCDDGRDVFGNRLVYLNGKLLEFVEMAHTKRNKVRIILMRNRRFVQTKTGKGIRRKTLYGKVAVVYADWTANEGQVCDIAKDL